MNKVENIFYVQKDSYILKPRIKLLNDTTKKKTIEDYACLLTSLLSNKANTIESSSNDKKEIKCILANSNYKEDSNKNIIETQLKKNLVLNQYSSKKKSDKKTTIYKVNYQKLNENSTINRNNSIIKSSILNKSYKADLNKSSVFNSKTKNSISKEKDDKLVNSRIITVDLSTPEKKAIKSTKFIKTKVVNLDLSNITTENFTPKIKNKLSNNISKEKINDDNKFKHVPIVETDLFTVSHNNLDRSMTLKSARSQSKINKAHSVNESINDSQISISNSEKHNNSFSLITSKLNEIKTNINLIEDKIKKRTSISPVKVDFYSKVRRISIERLSKVSKSNSPRE